MLTCDEIPARSSGMMKDGGWSGKEGSIRGAQLYHSKPWKSKEGKKIILISITMTSLKWLKLKGKDNLLDTLY